jgi:hypothetical protein
MELEGDEIVYVARFPSLHAVSVDLHVGSRLPAFCTAAGRAILSQMEPAEALARLKGVKRSSMTARTVTDIAGLSSALDAARKLGYALNNQEAFVGDVSVAAPLWTHRATRWPPSTSPCPRRDGASTMCWRDWSRHCSRRQPRSIARPSSADFIHPTLPGEIP